MPAIPYVHRPGLLLAGTIAFLVGWLLRRWASRNDMASLVTDAVTGAAWQAMKNREMPQMPGEITAKLDEFQSPGSSHTGKAKKAAGYAFRHFLAQIVSIAGWIGLLCGAALIAASVLWK